MNKYSDRIWLVLLGVAVAILVTLTTMFWNEPTAVRTGNSGPSVPSANQTRTPKIVTETLSHFSRAAFPSPPSVRSK